MDMDESLLSFRIIIFGQECKTCETVGNETLYDDEIQRVTELFGNHLERKFFGNTLQMIVRFLDLPEMYEDIFEEAGMTVKRLKIVSST